MEDSFHLGIKGLIKNSSGKILLLKTNTKQLRGYTGEAYWDIPGGRIQKGQTIEQTLKREIEEETGITSVQSFEPLEMVLTNLRIPTETGSVGLILYVFICNVKDIDNIQISDEHVEYDWFDPKEAAKLLEVKYPKEFTEKIKSL